MTIRYIDFADDEFLTADQVLEVQNNGVVQVDIFAELTALSTEVNTAYVLAENSLYVRKTTGWTPVGGLAVVQAAEPSAPTTGQLWFDTDLIFPQPQKANYNGVESVTETNFTALQNMAAISITVAEPLLVQINYGVVTPDCSDIDTSVTYTIQLSGDTVRAASNFDHTHSHGTYANSISNSFSTIINAGTTVITPVAKKDGSGTATLTYPYMEIVPIRWS